MKIYYFMGQSGRIYLFPNDSRDLYNCTLKIDTDLDTSDLYEFIKEYLIINGKGKSGWVSL